FWDECSSAERKRKRNALKRAPTFSIAEPPDLLGAESIHRINRGCAARGQITGKECRRSESQRDRAICDRIERLHAKEQRRHKAHEDDGGDEAARTAES